MIQENSTTFFNRNKNSLLLTGILIVTFLAFIPALFNGFVEWDDPSYIRDNILLRHFSLKNLKAIFATYQMGNYHPLTILSYNLEYQIGKLNPAIYHFTNIVFHILNTYLVFRFICLLSGQINIAAVTALLFGIHPMHVESVAWVSERKDVLYTFFYLLSCIYYWHYYRNENPNLKFYLLALLMFLFSLLSKAMAVTLPMVLLLIDYYGDRKISLQKAAQKIPFFILSLVFGIVAIGAQHSGNAIQSAGTFSIGDRILFACYEVVLYLWKMILPVHLSVFYPYPAKINSMLPMMFYISPALILILVSVLSYFRKNKIVIFGFLFFFFQIALFLQVIPLGSTIISERFTYLSYTGLFFILGSYFHSLSEKSFFQKIKNPLVVFGSIVVLLLFLLTFQRSRIWKDNFTLWTDSNEKHQSDVALNHIGNFYEHTGNYDLAEKYYNQSILLNPLYFVAYENRGKIYFYQQKYEAAFSDFNKALLINPKSEIALNHKGVAFGYLQQYDSAIYYFNKAIEVKNDFWECYKYRGNAYSKIEQFDLARYDYTVYVEFFDQDAEAYYLRGLSLIGLGKPITAIEDFSHAILLNPQYGDAYFARSTSYALLDKRQEALEDASKAKSLGYEVNEQYMEDLQK